MQPPDHAWARQADIESVLIPQQRIAQRVNELAQEILRDHQALEPDPRNVEITLIPILTGAVIFCADLMRALSVKLRIGLLTVTSYPGASIRSQGASLLSQQLGDLTGRHVLLIDDILDSGGTLKLVIPVLKSLNPASVKTCVLLSKDRPSAREVAADYIGFQIPDAFVVGYGLDYDNYYRNLPDIVTLKPSVLANK
jgi:hypoxanthine phosphoribosyltransferase